MPMFIVALANILVAVVVVLLLWYAIQTIRGKGDDGGCGSCSDDNKAGSACCGCEYANICHKTTIPPEKGN